MSIKKPAVVGIRAHSGWAALVAVAGNARALEVLDRRQVVLVDAERRGAKQPFHFAEPLALKEAEAHLSRCAQISARLALGAVRQVLETLRERGYGLTGCAILTASGRSLPDLAAILASHALIHAAEGQFFRNVFRDACQKLHIPVSPIRERDLFTLAPAQLRIPLADLKRQLADAGRTLGPPWTQDQKQAALAGWVVLASH